MACENMKYEMKLGKMAARKLISKQKKTLSCRNGEKRNLAENGNERK
jgi:hypothetical protein